MDKPRGGAGSAFDWRQRLSEAGDGLREAAAPFEQRAKDWLADRHEFIKPRTPSAAEVEAWLTKVATQFSWNSAPRSMGLEHLEAMLTTTIAAIRQTSDRRTRLVVNAVISKGGGAATVATIPALIATFGTASTGTPIVMLAGAAQTTAQLYWLGSLFGLGTAAGALILTGTGIGAGLLAGHFGLRWLLGRPRDEHSLEDHEKAIIVASLSLITALRKQIESGENVRPDEMRLVAEHALVPLVNQINQHWDQTSLDENGKRTCRAFAETLAFIPRRKLDRCRIELGRIAMAAMAADKSR